MSYLSIFINILSGLIFTPWVISSIGRADYGLYTLAMSVISLFVFDFGLSSAVTRFLSKYIAEAKQEKANKCLGLIYRLYIGLDVLLLLVFIIVYLCIPNIYKELTIEEIEKFKLIFILSAICSVLTFPLIPVNGILTAHEKFVQLKLCDVIHKLIIIILMSICLLFGYGLYALVIVNIIASVVVIIIKVYFIYSKTKQQVTWTYYNRDEFRNLLGFSGWTTIKSLSQRCIMNIAPSILGYYSGSVEIAVLGIAITLEAYTFTFANAINGMFLPRVSRHVAHNQDILPLMTKVGRIQVFIVGLIVFGYVFFGLDFIEIWVGSQFRGSYYAALFMIIPSFFHLPQEIAHQAVYALNKVKYEAIIFVLMAVFNLALSVILAPSYGAIGIGISIGISYFLRTAGMDVLYYKKMKINILQFFKESYIAIVPLFFIMALFAVILNISLHSSGWLNLILKITLFVICYSIVSFVLMNKDEKSLLAHTIKISK